MNEKLNEYFAKKGFKNAFINKCIKEYIIDHKRCFGEKITEDMIISRLNENLDAVKLFDYKTSKFNITENQVAAKYECFDKNTISLFVIKELINNEEYQGCIRDTLYHSLTHAIYLKKDKQDKNIAREMFGVIERAEVDSNVITMKDDDFIEAITNYISTTMCKRGNGNYVQETEIMNKITELIEPSLIIESSFNIDENLFKKALLALDKSNVFDALKKCLRLCKYPNFKNIAAQRFNDIIDGTGIEELVIEEEPQNDEKIIAAYKIDDISYINDNVNKMNSHDKLFCKIEIKSSALLNEEEKEILSNAISGEERRM